VVYDPPAGVVARAFVFFPRIAEADDEFHGATISANAGRQARQKEKARHIASNMAGGRPAP